MASTTEHLELALVDVEMFVSAGVPRRAFSVLRRDAWSAPDLPAVRVALAYLASLGWTVDHDSGSCQAPVQLEAGITAPHPYELGPIWAGANCWRDVLSAGGRGLGALVDHRWAEGHDGACHPGEELTSSSPWRWHVLGPGRSPVCGRAETPVLAAFAAEAVLIEAVAQIPARTKLRRALPD